MTEDLSQGLGERLEKSKQRRRMMVIAVLFVAGLFTGMYGGYVAARDDFDFAAPWSPIASLGFTALYLGAMLWGSLALNKNTDEIQRDTYYKMSALGGSIFMVVYPAWFMLWKGGFVPEPIHWLLFIIYWLGLVIGSVIYRIR